MAVYTDIDPDALAAFLQAYDVGRLLNFHGIAEGIENSNFHLVTERGRFILTLYEKRVDPADLPFFLGLMNHLAGQGVPCPIPIHGHDGQMLRQLSGRPAALISFLDGVSPGRIRPEQCRALGGALARLHLAGSSFAGTRANALSVAGWRQLLDACRPWADEVQAGLGAELEAELAAIERDWPSDLPQGVIHADLFPDNVFFQGPELTGIIDFYFACVDLFAYDLAICLNAWCFEPDRAFNITKARYILASYRAVRPIAPAELDALPLLARGAALRFLLTRLYDGRHGQDGVLVRPKDPLEYLDKLRFHRQVAGPAAYGLT